MLVSIIIINRDYAEFVPKAIQSALAQTYPDIQIIVVDDGSSDDSLSVISAFAPFIELELSGGRGHVEAANVGFAKSRGELVLFLDADDVLYPEAVSTAVAAFTKGVSKLQYMLDTIDSSGTDQNMPFPYYERGLDGPSIHRRCLQTGFYPWPVSSGNVFSREYLARVMPIDSARIFKSPDGFLNKLAPLHGPVLVIRKILGAYRVHGRNAWAQGAAGAKHLTYSRTCRFDVILHEFFVEHARDQGFSTVSYEAALVPQWIETRLLSKRFDGENHPLPNDRLTTITRLGLRAAVHAPGLEPRSRVLWALWFMTAALVPVRLLRAMVTRSRLQIGRSRTSSRLIAWTRGRKPPRPAQSELTTKPETRPTRVRQ